MESTGKARLPFLTAHSGAVHNSELTLSLSSISLRARGLVCSRTPVSGKPDSGCWASTWPCVSFCAVRVSCPDSGDSVLSGVVQGTGTQ